MSGEEQEIEQSSANIWDLDLGKYEAEEVTEETVSEVTEGSEGGEIIDQDIPEETEETEESVEETVEESEVDETEEESEIGDLMQALVSEDVLDIGDDEEREVDFSKEGLKELIQETVAKKSELAINSFKESLGDNAKGLLEVLEKGGTVDDYVNMSNQIDFNNISLEDDKGNQFIQNQKYLVEDWMKVQGYTNEEIKDTIGDYTNTGILKKQATIAKNKLAGWQKEQNESILLQKEEEKKLAEERSIAEAKEFEEAVLNTREIAGFKIPENKAKKLHDFITKTDEEGLSEFAKTDTPENRLLYAYFAMEGFDKEKLSKEIKTTQAKTLKRKLSKYTDSNTSPKRSGGKKKSESSKLDINWL